MEPINSPSLARSSRLTRANHGLIKPSPKSGRTNRNLPASPCSPTQTTTATSEPKATLTETRARARSRRRRPPHRSLPTNPLLPVLCFAQPLDASATIANKPTRVQS
ncbi:hypothetical protein M0R45_035214 [Rubus argutus]|uniref:Uncharacterized protein n=1 Tax=Rubus argutus TaxID=59490 RepID=A0AAW1VTZ9_RUBAR